MNISVRNQLKGILKELKHGPVSTVITIDVGATEIVSSITSDSAK